MSSRALKKLNNKQQPLAIEEEEVFKDELMANSIKINKKKNKKNKKTPLVDPVLISQQIEIESMLAENNQGDAETESKNNKNLSSSEVEEEEKNKENIKELNESKDDKEKSEDTSEEESEGEVASNKAINPFLLLGNDDEVEMDNEDQSEDLKEDIDNKPIKNIKNNKKKKKKSKKRVAKVDEENELEDKEFDRILEDIRKKFQDHDINFKTNNNNNNRVGEQDVDILKKLLNINVKCLDPLIETTRLFGSRIVNEEIRKKKFSRFAGRCLLASPRDFWPMPQNLGLSMGQGEKVENITYFNFQHGPRYRDAQKAFYQGVASLDPNAIAGLSGMFPYHVDTLLQLSDIAKNSGNMTEAFELIERALFACERGFSPSFSLTSGLCRLNYDQLENRSFYLALYRHIQNLSRQGCWRTALEFTKLILSFDPVHDNLCALLHLDFLALKAQQYSYLLEFNEQWIDSEYISSLPNYHYSCALAALHVNQNTKETVNSKLEKDYDHIDMLSSAIILYPNVILNLIKKTGISIDAPTGIIEQHLSLLESKISNSQESQIKLLADLYTERAFSLWKLPSVTDIISDAIKLASDKLRDSNNETVLLSKEIWSADSTNEIPLNLCRHILISEFSDLNKHLPKDLRSRAIYAHDPLPPPDSVSLYDDFKYLPGYTQDGSNIITMDSISGLLERIRNGVRNVLTQDSSNNDTNQLINALNAENRPGVLQELYNWLQSSTTPSNDPNGLPDDVSTDSGDEN
ncbi:DUF654-domain-containing protein [Neoconidiobolus thromboides FSU 785]|nr:DUF654-domain-containing protein [Neoconidiobolus thromboides FSU 785]